jgi:hypothetical protein
MATTNERLEQIENALLVLAGGGAGFAAGRLGTVPAARAAGRLTVGTPAGRAVLAAFTYDQLRDELIARDRELAEQELGLAGTTLSTISERVSPIPIPVGAATAAGKKLAKKARKKTTTKFNRAVKAGMAAVRNSKSYGKKGTINNARRAFSAVTKVASKVNRGKKVSAKGVTGTIARAVRKIL